VVYIAAPIQTFTTARYKRLIAAIREHFPEAVILESKHLYTSNADWLTRWPATLAVIDLLVFITDKDGYYGRGYSYELGHCLKRGMIPSTHIWYCDDREGVPTIYQDYPVGPFKHVGGIITDPRRCFRVVPRDTPNTTSRLEASLYWEARENPKLAARLKATWPEMAVRIGVD
jgi:hypothetical protein